MGNGSATYTRPCVTVGCKSVQALYLDFTDLAPVQLRTGGFKLVRIPGKGFAQTMAAFNYLQQALWLAAVEIAVGEARDSDDDVFMATWSDEILYHEQD